MSCWLCMESDIKLVNLYSRPVLHVQPVYLDTYSMEVDLRSFQDLLFVETTSTLFN